MEELFAAHSLNRKQKFTKSLKSDIDECCKDTSPVAALGKERRSFAGSVPDLLPIPI